MAESVLTVELTAPECASVRLEATEVVVPGEAGIFTVLPGHTAILSTLAPGVVLVYDLAGEEHFFAVSGGFAEVQGDRVKILAPTFEEGQNVDVVRAEAARDRGESRLTRPAEDLSVARAEMAIARSLARIGAQKRRGY